MKDHLNIIDGSSETNISIKQKTLSGLMWSFIDNFAVLGIRFIIGIVLARILSPREFGLIGMVTIFIAISQSFIESGFRQALIRKNNCTQADYSTVFYFNMVMGGIFFCILFVCAPGISRFFNEPALKSIVRVLGLVVIINSLTIVQSTILTKLIDFKLQARISIIAYTLSGGIGVMMALWNFGVWSLVVSQVAGQAMISLFLWMWNKWIPSLVFSKSSFGDLFGFGSKLLISGLLDTAYRNIYYPIIGKFFSVVELGYYSRAEGFANLPAQNLTNVIARVAYPVLSSMQDDIPRLRESYQILIRSTMFISFVLMIGLAAVAKPMVLTFIGEKWVPAVFYLQLLCFVEMFYPLHALNLNMLNVQGRSDLFLKLEIIKKCLAVPTIIAGLFWGIEAMFLGMIINTLIACYLNSYWSGKMIGYSFQKQILDIIPSFFVALSVGGSVFILDYLTFFSPLLTLLIQLFTGVLMMVFLSEIFQLKAYVYIKELANSKCKKEE